MSENPRAKPERSGRYSRALGRRICRRIVEGESLRAICAEAGMPSKSTVLMWAATQPEFTELYSRTRELAADADADDVAHLARLTATGELNPTAARAAIDGLKWAAAKRAPRRYGERPHPDRPRAEGSVSPADLSRLTDEELDLYERLVGKLTAAPEPTGDGSDPLGAQPTNG